MSSQSGLLLRYKVLIIGSCADERTYLRCLLESEGFEVAESSSGAQAMVDLAQSHPDVIVLDVDTQGMDGYSVCRKIREDNFLQDVPVILTSEYRKGIADRVIGFESGCDDFITRPVEQIEFVARVKAIIRRRALYLDSNPLTRLPGNGHIVQEIQSRLDNGQIFTCLYCDLNNFKIFNDCYGFVRGDEAIKLTAQILTGSVKALGEKTDFVGHIGGDDFAIITGSLSPEEIARDIISNFDLNIRSLYTLEDLKRGYIAFLNRKLQAQQFPIMGIVVAGISNQNMNIMRVEEVSSISAEIKKHLKGVGGSAYLIDRRKDADASLQSKFVRGMALAR